MDKSSQDDNPTKRLLKVAGREVIQAYIDEVSHIFCGSVLIAKLNYFSEMPTRICRVLPCQQRI